MPRAGTARDAAASRSGGPRCLRVSNFPRVFGRIRREIVSNVSEGRHLPGTVIARTTPQENYHGV